MRKNLLITSFLFSLAREISGNLQRGETAVAGLVNNEFFCPVDKLLFIDKSFEKDNFNDFNVKKKEKYEEDIKTNYLNLSIFDTHCHLSNGKYEEKDIEKIIWDAKEVGVKYILNVGTDKKSNQKVIEQLEKFPNLFGAIGLHPNRNDDMKEENLEWIENQLINERVIAIGETGLEYYRIFTDKEKQKYWFKRQLELAKKHDLPIILHIRDESEEAYESAYKIVKESGVKKGILHAFTGNWEIAQKFIEVGFYVSFAGNITDKEGKWWERWLEVVEKVPLEKLLVETDAPFITPIPKDIIFTVKKIAEIRAIGLEELAEKIYSNTVEFLKLEALKEGHQTRLAQIEQPTK